MEIHFRTKEESNAAQEKAFLALSGAERFMVFLEMIQNNRKLPTKYPPVKSDNFIIKMYKDD